jgi:hypothetical protein
MRCIFCLEEREPSVEHVFPDAIGGTLVIDRVCKTCNDWLGSNVDVLLTDHTLVMVKRNHLNITNRNGNTPTFDDIFGFATMANHPKQRVKMVQDRKTGAIRPTLLHREIRRTTQDGKEEICVVIDANQQAAIGKIIQRVRKREGFPLLSPTDLAEEIKSKVRAGEIKQPEVLHKVAVDLRDYQRAICKIVYELAWFWLGEDYLDDPVAVFLRNTILKGIEEKDIRGQIQIGKLPPFNEMWTGEPNAHIAFVKKAGPGISIMVRVFDVMSAGIVVTNSPERYPNLTQGDFFCCDPQTSERRNTTFPEELLRVFQEHSRGRA